MFFFDSGPLRNATHQGLSVAIIVAILITEQDPAGNPSEGFRPKPNVISSGTAKRAGGLWWTGFGSYSKGNDLI